MSKVCQWNIGKHGQSLTWSLHWSHTGNANPGKQAATPGVSIRERLPLRGGQSLDNSSSCQSPNTACRWVWPFLSWLKVPSLPLLKGNFLTMLYSFDVKWSRNPPTKKGKWLLAGWLGVSLDSTKGPWGVNIAQHCTPRSGNLLPLRERMGLCQVTVIGPSIRANELVQRLMNLVTLQRYQALSSASGTLLTWFKSHSLRQDIYLRVCGHLRQTRLSPPTTQRGGCSLCLPITDTASLDVSLERLLRMRLPAL